MRGTGADIRWSEEEMLDRFERGVGARAPAIQVIILVSSISRF